MRCDKQTDEQRDAQAVMATMDHADSATRNEGQKEGAFGSCD
jgi:hypothetical protein